MAYKLRVADSYLKDYVTQCEELNSYRDSLKKSLETEKKDFKSFSITKPTFYDSLSEFSGLLSHINEDKQNYHGDVIVSANDIQKKLIDLMQLSLEMNYKYQELVDLLNDDELPLEKRTRATQGLCEAKKRLKFLK